MISIRFSSARLLEILVLFLCLFIFLLLFANPVVRVMQPELYRIAEVEELDGRPVESDLHEHLQQGLRKKNR
jgi:hypothetical protein